MLPVAGSTAGDAQAPRSGRTSLKYWLNLRSQSTLPLLASTATSLSCVRDTSPSVIVSRYSRLPKVTGVERPPNGSVHATFSPDGDQLDGRFVSAERPSRLGPRDSGQSSACNSVTAAANTVAAITTERGVRGRAAKRRGVGIFMIQQGITATIHCGL